MTSEATPSHRFAPGLLVLAGGLVAGTLDILYACLFWSLLHHP